MTSQRYKYIKEWRIRTKARLVEAFGGKCGICSYNKTHSALEFHHLDESKKDFSISSSITKWSKLVEEVKKCILLCANCHREVHAGDAVIPVNIARFDNSYSTYIEVMPQDECHCGKLKKINKKFCSRKCADFNRYRIDWTKEDLVSKINSGETYSSLGREYNVSANTIKKWYKIQLMGQ